MGVRRLVLILAETGDGGETARIETATTPENRKLLLVQHNIQLLSNSQMIENFHHAFVHVEISGVEISSLEDL
jgi:hypothetical protein